MEFANLAHATAEDRVAVTNLTRENSTLTEQVALYANRISNKEADNIALQAYMRNLQGEIKNLKTKMYSLKKSRHSGGAGAANKDNGRIAPSRKREGPYHHPTWWSTMYCWSHGEGGHTGDNCKKKNPGHNFEATATTRLGGSTFGLPHGL